MGRAGQLGVGWGKWGQFTSNLRGRWTIPITTGGCQVSGRGHKGEHEGVQGDNGKGQGKQVGVCHVYAMYICNRIVCAME